MAYSKVIINRNGEVETIIDLTGDTVTAQTVLAGSSAHGKDGAAISGAMANNGDVSGTITSASGSITIPAGYTSGGGHRPRRYQPVRQ